MKLFSVLGEEELLAKKWFEENLEKWVEPAWRPFNLHILDGKKIPLEEFSGLIQSFPMGSSFRIVVVKNIEQADLARRKRIPDLARTAIDSTILIFWFSPSPADLKKLSLGKDLEEFLQECELVKFGLKQAEKEKWLQGALKEKNLKLSKEAEAFLLEASGGDLGRLELELEKISQFSAGNLSKSDLELLTPQGENATMFDLLDGIGERKGDKALGALKGLLEQGEPPLRILATVGGQLRLFWQIKALLEEKKSSQEIAKILGVHPFRVTKGLGHTRNFKPGELPRFAEWMARADWSLKTGKQEPRHVLELIVARICG